MPMRGENRRLTTIDQMEAKASEAEDSMCSKNIRGQWLSVERCLDKNEKYYYEYKWGRNVVPREVAVNVIATAGIKVREK